MSERTNDMKKEQLESEIDKMYKADLMGQNAKATVVIGNDKWQEFCMLYYTKGPKVAVKSLLPWMTKELERIFTTLHMMPTLESLREKVVEVPKGKVKRGVSSKPNPKAENPRKRGGWA